MCLVPDPVDPVGHVSTLEVDKSRNFSLDTSQGVIEAALFRTTDIWNIATIPNNRLCSMYR